MAVTATPALPQTPRHSFVTISSGTGSSVLVTIIVGGTNGTKITSVIGSNNDVVAAQVTWGLTSSAGTFGAFNSNSLSVSTGVGTSSGLAMMTSGIFPVDNDGAAYLFLNSSLESLQVKAATVPTSSGPGTYYFHAFGADF